MSKIPKAVTKERLYKALERWSDYRHRYRPGRKMDIMSNMSLLGLRSIIQEQTGWGPKLDWQQRRVSQIADWLKLFSPERAFRFRKWVAAQSPKYRFLYPEEVEKIEKYPETPKTQEELEEFQRAWRRDLEYSDKYRDRIYEIQRYHGISGLEQHEETFRGSTLTYLWDDEQLLWLDSDLEIVRSQKHTVTKFFICQVQEHNLTIWRRRPMDAEIDGWDVVEPSEIEQQAQRDYWDWAYITTYSDRQLSYSLGVGMSSESPNASIWYIATDGEQPPL